MSNFNFQSFVSMFGDQTNLQEVAFIVALVAILLSWQMMLAGLLSEV